MTSKELAAILETVPWRFAKTMPKYPHDYTLKKEWPSSSDFVAAVAAIRRFGQPRKWKGRVYTYFDTDKYTYWTMGAPIQATVLINRALRNNK